MIAAYFDRNGLPNIYSGPTNGGVMPTDNSTATTGWPTWKDVSGDSYPGNPLTASRNGLDGRTTIGSIDDYWVYYGSSVSTYPDPYIKNGWTQHTWGDAVGDYMWTSQSAFGNTDGATTFWGYSSATKLTCAALEAGNYKDGSVGRKRFYEARGYTVSSTECYNQRTDNQVSGGFSFASYKAKINAGYPVFLNLAGHSIVGIGYNDTTSPPTVYLNDTWSWTSGATHAMPWGGAYAGLTLISVSIVDPVLPSTTPTVSIGDATVTEGNSGATGATFAVNLSSPSNSTVTVDWATAPGTAADGTDYVAGSGTLTFAPGVTSQTVSVQVNGDTAVEPNETFSVNLSNSTGATVLDGQGLGTISNDDQAPAPTISINDVQVIEGNSGNIPATFTVSLSAPASSTVTVNWATAPGTAAEGTDYLAGSGTLTFAPGVTTQTISVQVNGDTAVEPNETCYVNLSNSTGAAVLDGQGLGTISNDDQAPAPTISINDVQVTEGNSGKTPATFTVSLSAPASSTVTAAWTAAGSTATKSKDFVTANGTVTFAPGVTSQPVTIQVIGETTVEANETFYVNLSSPVGATLADAQGVGTILNDDAAPVLHVGDLDGSGVIRRSSWTASVTLTVHDASHTPVPSATVSAIWSGTTKAVTCITGTTGVCTLSRASLTAASVQLTVRTITKTGATYSASANHDPDGDSNGSVITVAKP
jgi:hypothetical protein